MGGMGRVRLEVLARSLAVGGGPLTGRETF